MTAEVQEYDRSHIYGVTLTSGIMLVGILDVEKAKAGRSLELGSTMRVQFDPEKNMVRLSSTNPFAVDKVPQAVTLEWNQVLGTPYKVDESIVSNYVSIMNQMVEEYARKLQESVTPVVVTVDEGMFVKR